MKMNSYFPNALTHKETRNGWIYLAVSMTVLPFVLQWGNAKLAAPLSDAKLNFVYYCINFAAVVWIFRYFLADSLRVAVRRLFGVLWYGTLGYLGAEALGELLLYVLIALVPGFVNINDLSISLMIQKEPLLAAAVVLLVPVAEECFYRGLIFRNLHNVNVAAAYLVSMAVFAAIHVVGYIGVYSPLHLIVSFIQYLPAGYCLAWCYRQTGTIMTPIFMHTLVNAMGVYYTMR